MQDRSSSFFRPFMLMLKEGDEIEQDYMDYKLVMLNVGSSERIRSPKIPGHHKATRPLIEMMPKGNTQILTSNDPLF